MEKCCKTVESRDEKIRPAETFLPRLSGPGVNKLSDTVWFIDDVLTGEECQSLIDFSTPNLARSTVLKDEESQTSSIHDHRTSKNAWIKGTDLIDQKDSLAAKTLHKMEKISNSITGLPIPNQEGLQLLKYLPGEEYKSHHDFFHETGTEYKQCMAQGGQRLWTIFFYLSDVEEGGETRWPRLDVEVKPKLGRVAIWKNLVDGEVFHPSLHWGKPVIKGVKWAATKWIRERRFATDGMTIDTLLRLNQGEELPAEDNSQPHIPARQEKKRLPPPEYTEFIV